MGRLRAALMHTLHVTVLLILCAALPCLGAEEADLPISIEANRMVSQENKHSVVFIGKVDARQGNLIIRSDEMTVFYTESPESKGSDAKQPTNQVEKLISTGNVKVSQGDWLGTGDRMDYFAKERKAVLSGNAKAWQGQNMVTGKTIVYYLDEKRSVVEPDGASGGRVRAVIHPDKKKP